MNQTKVTYNGHYMSPGTPAITFFNLFNYESIDIVYLDMWNERYKEISEALGVEFKENKNYFYHLKEDKWYEIPMIANFEGLMLLNEDSEDSLENFIFIIKEIIRLRKELTSIEFTGLNVILTTPKEVLTYTYLQ